MTTILKDMSSSQDSFLLPATMASKRSPQMSQAASVKLPNTAVLGSPHAYAEMARTAAVAEDSATNLITDLEKERRTLQVEFEKRVKLAEEEARSRGLEEGLSQGREQGREEWLDQVESAKEILVSLDAQQRDFAATLEDELVALVFAGITRVVGTAAASLASVQEVVRQAIADDGGRLIVRVAPDDFEFMSAALKESSSDKIEIAPDPRVALGGCILESDRGTLDARLETQIEKIRKAMLAVRTPPVER